MKKIIFIGLFYMLVACGPSAPAPTAVPEPDQTIRPTPTADPALQNPAAGQSDQAGYPPPPPTPEPFPEGYPVPSPQPTINPYPEAEAAEGTVWILHPLGEQCEDVSTYKYPNAQEARAGLTAAGITVYTLETVDLMVCQACNCPTSTHYRVEIAAADLDKALALGWQSQ